MSVERGDGGGSGAIGLATAEGALGRLISSKIKTREDATPASHLHRPSARAGCKVGTYKAMHGEEGGWRGWPLNRVDGPRVRTHYRWHLDLCSEMSGK